MNDLNTYIVTRMVNGVLRHLTIVARNPGDASRKADAYVAAGVKR